MRLPKGMLSMLVATVFFVLMNVFVKLLPRIPIAELIFFRAIFTFIFSYVYLRLINQNPWGSRASRPWLFLRGIGGGIALSLYFYLMTEIPLATIYTLQYLSPIFTVVMAFFWLGERIRPIQWMVFVLAFGGVAIVQGFDSRISMEHFLIGVTATLFMSATYVVVRRLKGMTHPLVVVFYFPVVVLPLLTPWLVVEWVQPKGIEWLWLLGMASSTQIAQYFVTRAAFEADVLWRVSAISYLGIVFAIVAGFFFGEYYAWIAYLGMFAIVASLYLNLFLSPKEKDS